MGHQTVNIEYFGGLKLIIICISSENSINKTIEYKNYILK